MFYFHPLICNKISNDIHCISNNVRNSAISIPRIQLRIIRTSRRCYIELVMAERINKDELRSITIFAWPLHARRFP